MEKFPREVLERFLKGEHVMRHQKGFWNAIWSDMFIETTFMRYGKGPGGLIGVTLDQTSVKKWANRLHISTQILNDLEAICDKGHQKEKIFHKEEMKGRIKSDGEPNYASSMRIVLIHWILRNILLNLSTCTQAC